MRQLSRPNREKALYQSGQIPLGTDGRYGGSEDIQVLPQEGIMHRLMFAMICAESLLIFTPVNAAAAWGCYASNSESDAGGQSHSWKQPSRAVASRLALKHCEDYSLNSSIAAGGYGVCSIVFCEANINSCQAAGAAEARYGVRPGSCPSQ